MKYTYQDITNLQSEAQVSFEIADKALKKAKGNFNKALYTAMKKKKKQEKRTNRTRHINEILREFFAYRFQVYKKEFTYINIRMWIVLLALFIFSGLFYDASVFVIIPFIITLFFGVEYKVSGNAKKADNPIVNVEPVKEPAAQEDELNILLSEEKVEDDEEGFAKVEIDK